MKLLSAFIYIAMALIAAEPVVSQSTGAKNNPPKNIIIMIADGWGYNQIKAANYFLDGKDKSQVYESFPVQFAICHYPAMTGSYDDNPANSKLKWSSGYNPGLAWTDFKYVMDNFTESAASGTALATGKKTYNNAIGTGLDKEPLKNLTELAEDLGKSSGVVTTVPISHATPAAFTAHNETRLNYAQIAREMLLDSRLEVIMGAGHPLYDDNGRPATKANYKYTGDSAVFHTLIRGTEIEYPIASNSGNNTVKDCNGDGQPDPWLFIETKKQFMELANSQNPPTRICGVAQAGSTLQQNRTYESSKSMPFSAPFNENVPSLETMVKGAINVLSRNNNGYFLMIEGGAIDWANHSNRMGRMIEEMDDFNKAVEYVAGWIEANGGWGENLLIVCGDHETGYITGPKNKMNHPVKNPVVNNGKGKMPGARYNSSEHTNSLIPLFAKGTGCEIFDILADEADPVRGRFIQNTEIAQVCFLLWGLK